MNCLCCRDGHKYCECKTFKCNKHIMFYDIRWESMLRYSEMDAEELSELSHKKVQELQQLRKEIREV